MVNPGRRQLVELEALRGIAAMIVFFHHFLLLIAPRLHGRNFPDDPIALVRTPLFALVNGSAAVAVFFVLSGFVLTVGAMEDRDWRQFLIGVLKRWPRLALLVVVVNIASAIFFMLGLYRDSMWFNLHNYACCRYVRARCICREAANPSGPTGRQERSAHVIQFAQPFGIRSRVGTEGTSGQSVPGIARSMKWPNADAIGLFASSCQALASKATMRRPCLTIETLA
jgi:hypothetical protein